MKSRLIFSSMLALFTCQWALGQQSGVSKVVESHRYRTILTIAGGGGGFAVGTFVGLAAFDDATNSDGKVWTTAALSGVGGAVAGYFIGRALDKRPKKTTVTQMREELERRFRPGLRGWLRRGMGLRTVHQRPGAAPSLMGSRTNVALASTRPEQRLLPWILVTFFRFFTFA